MKKILLCLMIASPAFAAEPVVLKFKANVNVHSLACLTEVGRDAQFTVLRSPTILQDAGKILLKHDVLSAEDCDMAKLEELYKQSINTFWFLEADIEVRRVVTPQVDFALCSDLVTEEIKVDLGQGIVLASVQSAERNARSCK